MDFDETVRAVETLVGELVAVTVWGTEGEQGGTLASFTGTLESAPEFDADEFANTVPPNTLEALRTAVPSGVSFNVGNSAQVTLLPDRFVRGDVVRGSEVTVMTRDGVISIQRPWL